MKEHFDSLGWMDTASGKALYERQDALFREHVIYAAGHSPYYKKKFMESGLDLNTLTLADLHKLPVTEKADLNLQNDDFLAVDMTMVRDMVFSSGTTGVPTSVYYTERDLERLAYNERSAIGRLGVNDNDIVLLTCTMDRCFVAGLAYYSGVRSLGATAIRNGANSLPSHMSVIVRTSPTVIVGVPSFLLKLGKFLADNDHDPSKSGVSRLLCIGEPLRDQDMNLHPLGASLETLWGAKVFSTYASSEIVTSFCECDAQAGGHLDPSMGIVEILDDSGNPVAAGQTGEVVVTPLQVEGFPLIRYRTGDMSFLLQGQCACGRSTPRLGPVLGRRAHMLKVRGTTVYPQSVFAVLDGIDSIKEYCMIVDDDYVLSENIKIVLCSDDDLISAEDIAQRLQAALRVRPEVLLEAESKVLSMVFPGGARKPMRFIDRRER
jgi:phenylacetate-CoA ligase